MADQGVVEQMCDLLSSNDSRIVLVALEGLDNILRVGEADAKNKTGVNAYATRVESCSGLDKIESLQNHSNNDVYDKALQIIEIYFGAEEEDQNLAPNQTVNTFQFATNTSSNFCF